MYCKKCGKDIQDDATFCQHCGEKVSETLKKEPMYNTIPIWKVIVLAIMSFGIYQIVWAYNLWKQGQKCYNEKISPFWRSIFIPITCFKLFPLINDYITNIPKNDNEVTENSGINRYIQTPEIKPFHAIGFATTYFLFNCLGHVLSKLCSKSQEFSTIDLLSFIPTIVIFSIIVIIQIKINRFNYKYSIPAKNDKWTWKTTGFALIYPCAFVIYVVILAITSY